MSAPGSPGGVDAAMAQLFGDVKAFSAMCNMRMLEKDDSEKMSAMMDFELLDGKMRVEVDLTKMKAKDLSPDAAASMKQMGMDRVISIVQPDKKNQVLIYPGMKSCITMPLPKQQADALSSKSPKIEKTALGKETIDGHACTKEKVVITYDNGESQEFTVWSAEDLKEFPVQVRTTQDGDAVILLFKQIKLSKPAASKFEVPSDYKQYDNMGSFMQAMMARMMQGQ